MARRGPKPKTETNSKARPVGSVDWSGVSIPDHLSDRGKAEFARLVEMLRSAGTLNRTDPRMVEAYAINYDMLVKASMDVERDGVTTENRFGASVPHPALSVINQATVRLRGLINDMGLCPRTSRYVGQPAPKAGDGDPWEGLLNVAG